MMRLKSDLFDVLMHATDGTLDQVELQWDRRVALGVVMAAAGYPQDPARGVMPSRPARRARTPWSSIRHHAPGWPAAHQRRPRAVRDGPGRFGAHGTASRHQLMRASRSTACNTADIGHRAVAEKLSDKNLRAAPTARRLRRDCHVGRPWRAAFRVAPALCRCGCWPCWVGGSRSTGCRRRRRRVIVDLSAHLHLGLPLRGAGQSGPWACSCTSGAKTRCSAFLSCRGSCATSAASRSIGRARMASSARWRPSSPGAVRGGTCGWRCARRHPRVPGCMALGVLPPVPEG